MPERVSASAAAWAAGVAILAVAYFRGGWEWALLAAVPLAAALTRAGNSAGALVAAGVAGLAWLALSRLFDNRQLYFPYTLFWALELALLWASPAKRWMGAAAVVALFTAVRVAQEVTAPVLVKELIVAAIAVAIALHYAATATSPARRFMAAILASLMAFAGLAI